MPIDKSKIQPKRPHPEPSKVRMPYMHDAFAPPSPSQRLGWWLEYLENGWLPDERVRDMPRERAIEFFGVFAWEFREVLVPRMRALREARDAILTEPNRMNEGEYD